MTGIMFTKFELLITDWTHITANQRAACLGAWTWSSFSLTNSLLFHLIANWDFYITFCSCINCFYIAKRKWFWYLIFKLSIWSSNSSKCQISTQTPPDLLECSPLVTRRSNEAGQRGGELWSRVLVITHYTAPHTVQVLLSTQIMSQPFIFFIFFTIISPNYISPSHILHILHY